MTDLSQLKIKVFADGADLASIKEHVGNPIVKGFTTNPSLMRNAGVSDYKSFALSASKLVAGKPISFEVFSDDADEMVKQGQEIASWNDNINVKIPVINTEGKSTISAIQSLSRDGITVNVTAIFTRDQYERVIDAVSEKHPSIISIFAGRIADSGIDPTETMRAAVEYAKSKPKAEILWASTREPHSIIQAEACGCQIITVERSILDKACQLFGKNLQQYSVETVKRFYDDAMSSGFSIPI
ncbi:MAG: transaldolase [Rhodospirillales bacterium]|nr:transaldolase [Rhodospirillales bacterium]